MDHGRHVSDCRHRNFDCLTLTRIETHPRNLLRSNIPLTIICGPPCSGKTTYVEHRKSVGDQVIDLDDIQRQLDPNFRPWKIEANFDLLRRAIRLRNLMLQRLAILKSGKAWFIVSAPTETERAWWQLRLGGEVVLMTVDATLCKHRAIARGTPEAVLGIDQWFERSSMLWVQPQYHHAIREDGWIDEDD